MAVSSESSLPKEIQTLVQYVYSEATNALTTTVAAKITERGIETPLGVLSLQQVQKGEQVLDSIADVLKV